MDIEHIVAFHYHKNNGDHFITCSCGASWTQPAVRTLAELEEIFQAHVRYAKHQPMKTL